MDEESEDVEFDFESARDRLVMFDVFVVCVRDIFSLLSSQTFSLFRLKRI